MFIEIASFPAFLWGKDWPDAAAGRCAFVRFCCEKGRGGAGVWENSGNFAAEKSGNLPLRASVHAAGSGPKTVKKK